MARPNSLNLFMISTSEKKTCVSELGQTFGWKAPVPRLRTLYCRPEDSVTTSGLTLFSSNHLRPSSCVPALTATARRTRPKSQEIIALSSKSGTRFQADAESVYRSSMKAQIAALLAISMSFLSTIRSTELTTCWSPNGTHVIDWDTEFSDERRC